ncbi:glycosyltransferase family 2 protein [Sphingobacterium sp. PU5-4]|uniref:Glycosyltransferase family 2 protein n=1 Tax=Sphingobacterium tenebrionis TaxID=3111775 RepID=A0ABU8I1S9_9SPHI
MTNLKNPKVSIAIPFYNAEKYLSLAIDSVIYQSYINWELLLIDDGSNDSSVVIAKNYEKVDNRIRLYSDGLNKNLGYRLNQIPDLVHGEFLCRMDADDIMHPNKIEKQVDFLIKNPTVDVLGTNAYSIDENGNVQGIRANTDVLIIDNVRGFIHPTIMAKTSWFKNNPYDVDAVRIEDAELWLRTARKSNFKVLGTPLFFYREFGTHYYKKYLKGIPSLWYLLKKHKMGLSFVMFSLKYLISTLKIYLYFIFGKEHRLIKKRNQKIIENEINWRNYV